MQRKERGRLGESLALSWLECRGYTLLDRNFCRRIGELDLVVRHPDGRTVVFVEVRYRSGMRQGGALESVDARKQQKLRRTAGAWLQRYACSTTPARIDVIALSPLSRSDQRNLDNTEDTLWQDHRLTWVVSAVED